MDKKIFEKLEIFLRSSKNKENPATIKYICKNTNVLVEKKAYKFSFKWVKDTQGAYDFYFLSIDHDQTYETVRFESIIELSNGSIKIFEHELSVIVADAVSYLEELPEYWHNKEFY